MKTYRLLFKHERRSLFPSLKHKKLDLIGGLLTAIVALLVIATFALMIYAFADSYVEVKDVETRQYNKPARAIELLNALYTVIIVALGFMCLEKLRTNLVRKTDKNIFLRLPIKQSTLFLAKFSALLLWAYTTAFFLIVPVNAIFFIILRDSFSALGLTVAQFWIHTAIVYLLLPMASFLIATLLIIPYTYVINFLSTRYFISFITVSALVVGAFLLYSSFLSAFQDLILTGDLKVLFNLELVHFLQALRKFSYPATSLASIVLGDNLITSVIIAGATAVIAFVVILFSTNILYKMTLYRNAAHTKRGRRKMIRCRSVLGGLMRKEFISVFREPKHMFSYFSIALSMPIMVYCCYTLFHTFISESLPVYGFSFSLALMVILVFTTLTNTFCATNITRDGLTALKAKMFPIKASKILFAKVLFCCIVSSLAVIGGVAILYLAAPEEASLSLKDALIVGGIGLVVSLSQIMIATRMDLNHAVLTASPSEVAVVSNRTISKTVILGLFLALVTGLLSIVVQVFPIIQDVFGQALPESLRNLKIKDYYIYLVPAVITALYFFVSFLYYSVRIEKSFKKLVR